MEYLLSPSPAPRSPSPIDEGRGDDYIKALLLTMYYEQSEHLHSEFSESYLQFRRVVCVWMIEVCEFFRLHITTTHAAICYLDRLMPGEKCNRFEWQMLAVCCIIIASKYNECEEHVPPLSKLGEITQQSIRNDVLLDYELFALKRMAWKLNARTTIAFLCSYMELGFLSESDVQLLHSTRTILDDERSISEDSVSSSEEGAAAVAEDRSMMITMMLKSMHYKAQKLATKVLLEPRFKGMQCSAVAAAILFYTRRICCLDSQFGSALPAWTEELTKMTFHHPLKHRGAMQALALIFEMEGESAAEFNALFPPISSPLPDTPAAATPAPSSSSRADKDLSEIWDQGLTSDPSEQSFVDTPAKSKAKAVVVTPPVSSVTAQQALKDMQNNDQSPVSMNQFYDIFSP